MGMPPEAVASSSAVARYRRFEGFMYRNPVAGRVIRAHVHCPSRRFDWCDDTGWTMLFIETVGEGAQWAGRQRPNSRQ
jgi:hypothetical protein